MADKTFLPDFANMCVVEKAEKVKPVIDDYYLSGDYATDLDVYEQHIASLRTIQAPWLDKSKHDRELVEGVDFRIVYRISQSSGWVATHFTMYDKFPDDKRRITTVPLSPAEPPAGEGERFVKPTYEQVIKAAILFNDERLNPQELINMVSLSMFIIDRLYENGNIAIPSSKENKNG